MHTTRHIKYILALALSINALVSTTAWANTQYTTPAIEQDHQQTIIETDDIQTILHHVYDTHHHHDILVVFDIDNTIAHVEDGFGGDEMFSALVTQKIIHGTPINAAVSEVLPLYIELQNNLWLTPVDPVTPNMIKFLQDIDVAVMALTARSFPLMGRTFTQLAHIDIDFAHTSLHDGHLDMTMEHVAKYENGIMFSGNNNKGELLAKFFDTIDYHPQKVIFIDDKMKYVEQVGAALAKYGIPYVGIRYSKCDQKAASFKLEDHQERLEQFCAEHCC